MKQDISDYLKGFTMLQSKDMLQKEDWWLVLKEIQVNEDSKTHTDTPVPEDVG